MKENKEETKLQSEQKTAEEIHPDVAAWNKFKAENKESFRADTVTHDRYLENRLWAAFFAGRDHAASQFKSQLPSEPDFDGPLAMVDHLQRLCNYFENEAAKWENKFKQSQPLPIEGVEREWISVEERLPQESGRYWCYVVHFGELGRSSEQVNCSYSERHGFTEKLNPMNVTHWMPLPPPPKKNG